MSNCCGGPHSDQALNLPRGSVRAILSLIAIPTTFFAAVALMILMFVREQYETALGILSTITGLIGAMIGYYFGSKSGENAAKLVAQAEHEIIESRNKEIAARQPVLRMMQNDEPDENSLLYQEEP